MEDFRVGEGWREGMVRVRIGHCVQTRIRFVFEVPEASRF